jgi:hypothetical protein
MQSKKSSFFSAEFRLYEFLLCNFFRLKIAHVISLHLNFFKFWHETVTHYHFHPQSLTCMAKEQNQRINQVVVTLAPGQTKAPTEASCHVPLISHDGASRLGLHGATSCHVPLVDYDGAAHPSHTRSRILSCSSRRSWRSGLPKP